MAKWESDIRRRNAFGGAPYGEPFYIDDNMNIVTGFNDRFEKTNIIMKNMEMIIYQLLLTRKQWHILIIGKIPLEGQNKHS